MSFYKVLKEILYVKVRLCLDPSNSSMGGERVQKSMSPILGSRSQLSCIVTPSGNYQTAGDQKLSHAKKEAEVKFNPNDNVMTDSAMIH